MNKPESTEDDCRKQLAAWYAKQKGYQTEYELVPNISDSNWLDEIENMLLGKARWTVIYSANTTDDLRWFQYEGESFEDEEAPTRNLARARCLCKIIDKLKEIDNAV